MRWNSDWSYGKSSYIFIFEFYHFYCDLKIIRDLFRNIFESFAVRRRTKMGAKKSKLSDKAVKELADKTKCKSTVK